MKRLLNDDGGVSSVFHYDPDGDKSTIETVQDCEPIVENNKALQTDGTTGDFQGKWGRRIASIPLVVAQKWMQEDGVNWLALPKHEKAVYLRRKLNDPQWRHLRTSAGRF